MTRVALLDDGRVERLAAALRAAGCDATVLAAAPIGAVDAVLSRRGFAVPLSHAPVLAARLRGGRFDVAHAFTAIDAVAAQAARTLAGGRVVLTFRDPLTRGVLADRRLRLASLRRAVERSDAVLAATEPVQASLWRWLRVDAPVVDPGDAAAQLALYAALG